MASNHDTLNTFASQLKESLICTVCSDLSSFSPIYQCENGHLFCNNCWSLRTKCPSCQWELSQTRSLLAEQIRDHIFVPCVNQGCKEKVLMICGQVKHDEKCRYTPMECPILNCNVITCLENLKEHYRTIHFVQNTAVNNFSGKFKLPDDHNLINRFWPLLINFESLLFFVEVTKKCDFYYFWVYCNGGFLETSKTFCDIKIKGSRQTYSMNGPCLSILLKTSEIIESDSVLVLTEKVFESLIKQDDENNKFLDMEVSISLK